MKFDSRVQRRFQDIGDYLIAMRDERAGWGPEFEREVADTATSFVRAVATLTGAEEVWIEGQHSFTGQMPGGIYFGMIATLGPSRFDHPPIEWTFHS